MLVLYLNDSFNTDGGKIMKKAKTIAAGIAIAAIIFLVVYIIMPLALTFAAGLNRRYNQDKMRRRRTYFPAACVIVLGIRRYSCVLFLDSQKNPPRLRS